MTVDEIIAAIDGLTVGEMREMTLKLQEKFGVTAAQQPQFLPGVVLDVEEVEEQFEFDVILVAANPDNKVQTIKAVREVTNLGLKEAKEVVDTAPSTVASAVSKEDALRIKGALEISGATVEIK